MSDGDRGEVALRRRRLGSAYDVAPLVDAIWALDNSADVSKLASLAVPRA